VIASLPWFPPVDVTPEGGGDQAERDPGVRGTAVSAGPRCPRDPGEVDVAPEGGGDQVERDPFDNRNVAENNNTRVMWMRGAARIQKQVVNH